MIDNWQTMYLERIKHTGNFDPSFDSLQAVHQAHLFSVPFEDLDIHLDVPLSLTLNDLLEKVVVSHRGGFCYELNHLFGQLLQSFGFEVSFIAAQVHGEAGAVGDYFDHMALVVNQTWLADVGFGGSSFLKPLSLEDRNIQPDAAGFYQIRELAPGKFQLMMSPKISESLKPLYNFDLLPQEIAAFQAQCIWKQIHEESHFRKNKICTMATERGRDSLLNQTFTRRMGDDKKIIEITDKVEEKKILRKYFNITI